MAALRTELKTYLAEMCSELDANKSDVAAVRSDLATLFYIVKKGEKEWKEAAGALII